ncbi:MAG: hypothetical protein ACXWV9_05680 [Flavisolibacter sp.]
MNPFTMRAIRLNYLLILFTALIIYGCSKTEEFKTELISDYVPLIKGKYITYQIDSTVFTNFGRNTETHTYEEKHIVDEQITDGLGRPSFRIFRFIKDIGQQDWRSSGSYFITPLNNTLEVIENNLRFVKLAMPLTVTNTWKGNRYLPIEPYSQFYSFNNDLDIDTWDYTINSSGETITLNGQAINDVLTVDGINDIINVPVTDAAAFGSISYQTEKYAKGIGLVFQEYILWEYQPNTSGAGGGYKIGFGVKRSMIDHN